VGIENARWWFEDFPEGSVREFGGVTVSKEDIVAFARQYDPQPFHVDEEAALGSAFGGLVASGWHTCALTMRMTCDAFLLHAASAGSPGMENVRWLKPVRPGDTLRVRLRTVRARALKSRPNLGVVRQAFEVTNQSGETVLTMEGSMMMYLRSGHGHVPGPSTARPDPDRERP
jgi:acyl dehydratase